MARKTPRRSKQNSKTSTAGKAASKRKSDFPDPRNVFQFLSNFTEVALAYGEAYETRSFGKDAKTLTLVKSVMSAWETWWASVFKDLCARLDAENHIQRLESAFKQIRDEDLPDIEAKALCAPIMLSLARARIELVEMCECTPVKLPPEMRPLGRLPKFLTPDQIRGRKSIPGLRLSESTPTPRGVAEDVVGYFYGISYKTIRRYAKSGSKFGSSRVFDIAVPNSWTEEHYQGCIDEIREARAATAEFEKQQQRKLFAVPESLTLN